MVPMAAFLHLLDSGRFWEPLSSMKFGTGTICANRDFSGPEVAWPRPAKARPGGCNIYQIVLVGKLSQEVPGVWGSRKTMDRFVAKLRSRQAISAEDEARLRDAGWVNRRFERHEVIVRAGEPLDHIHLLLNGFACRSQEDSAGGRQILGIGIPGDIADIHGAVLGRLEQELVALSPCEVATLPHRAVRALTAQSPAIQKVFWLQAAIDHAVQSAWIQALGNKRGVARLAHVFCEMQLRLGLVGIAAQMGFPLPLSQQELADYVGMTHVHLNRCLKELREARLLTFAQGWAKVLDWDRLKQVAHFDEAYLNLRLIEV